MIEEQEDKQSPEEAPAEEPVAPDDASTEESGGGADAEAPSEQPDAPAEEAEAPAEPPDAGAPEAAGDEEAAAPLGPKERRRQRRSLHQGEPRPERSPEERAAEREERRRKEAAGRSRWRERSRQRRGGAGEPQAPPPAREHGPGRPKERQGIVVSDKADKTITVRIDVTRRHRTYKKIVRESTTLHAHDEQNEAHAGDTVRIVESRPLSRLKRWRLVEVLERAR